VTIPFASVDELLLHAPVPDPDRSPEKLVRMQLALEEATEQLLDELGGVRLHRSPATGQDEVRTFDAPGGRVLHVHGGIVALAGVRIRASVTSDWETIDLADVRLEYWANTGQPHAKPSDEPYDHLVFVGTGTRTTFPRGTALVELTGAYEWPLVPQRAVKASIDIARQALAADPAFGGGPQGPPELGRPQVPNRLPLSAFNLKMAMARRFVGCHI